MMRLGPPRVARCDRPSGARPPVCAAGAGRPRAAPRSVVTPARSLATDTVLDRQVAAGRSTLPSKWAETELEDSHFLRDLTERAKLLGTPVGLLERQQASSGASTSLPATAPGAGRLPPRARRSRRQPGAFRRPSLLRAHPSQRQPRFIGTPDDHFAVGGGVTLTRDEDELLCKAVQEWKGLESKEVKGVDEVRWAAIKAKGLAAQDRICRANVGLVRKLVSKFLNRGVERDDLMIEGFTSLMRAAQTFDASHGARLSSHAWNTIYFDLQSLVYQQGALIPMPAGANAELAATRRAEVELTQHLGRAPTVREVADKVGLLEERVTLLRSRSRTPVAWEGLSASIDREGTTRGADEIISDEALMDAAHHWHKLAPDALSDAREFQHGLDAAVDVLLASRESRAIVLRYGLEDGIPRTLDEVGRLLHPPVSSERVRHIINSALHRLASSRDVVARGLMAPVRSYVQEQSAQLGAEHGWSQ